MHNGLNSNSYYIDINGALIFFNKRDNSHAVLDDGVESILYYCYFYGDT